MFEQNRRWLWINGFDSLKLLLLWLWWFRRTKKKIIGTLYLNCYYKQQFSLLYNHFLFSYQFFIFFSLLLSSFFSLMMVVCLFHRSVLLLLLLLLNPVDDSTFEFEHNRKKTFDLSWAYSYMMCNDLSSFLFFHFQ